MSEGNLTIAEVLDPRNGWRLVAPNVYYKETEPVSDVEGLPIPVNRADLVTGEEYPNIDNALLAQGYMGAEYEGRDPSTNNLYYFMPETNLRVVYVPDAGRIFPIR